MTPPRMMPGYDTMADQLGVLRCYDPLCTKDHEDVGSYSRNAISGPVIHFSDRPLTKANVLTFLRLVARAKDPRLDIDFEPWRRVYLINVRVRELARALHIGNPAGAARSDRAFVLASVAGVSNEVPMRKQAYDWARRGPKRTKET